MTATEEALKREVEDLRAQNAKLRSLLNLLELKRIPTGEYEGIYAKGGAFREVDEDEYEFLLDLVDELERDELEVKGEDGKRVRF